MAFTDLRVENFTMTGSLVFENTTYPSNQNNYAFCQVRFNNNNNNNNNDDDDDNDDDIKICSKIVKKLLKA